MHFNSKRFAELKEEINSLSPLEKALAYFEAKLPDLIQDQPVGGCWDYHRKDPDGYGLLSVFGKSYRLHRLSYLHFNGPLKDGQWALHRCNNPNCWRPDHLYAGNGADNAADRIAAGAVRGKLPDETVFLIKRLIRDGLSNKKVAEQAGVSPGCVSHIRLGKRRKDIAA
ncbi:HNH endonuclease [Nodosilinea sp. LEGE 07298]|uniref:HNH endonuclease n=1 Tax=Nodosilinea sp. LEGE 07298 TaxID=2777970 RepID=UPI00187ECE74|nr:HNH endonuclease [Nodosilinea sp. LEGE 07298]MBE9111462.1 HNH endonuclease [Nodosilinea sp. LEGE 07298]